MNLLPGINFIHEQQITSVSRVAVLALATLVLSLILTPVYTNLAYKYKWWKQVRETTTTGEEAPIFRALHAEKFKRNVPTMGGIITIFAVVVVTVVFNLSRSQTWLPLFAFVSAGAVGLLDDYINIRGSGKGVAGLRGMLKIGLISVVAAMGAYWFYFKLGYHMIHVPAVGDFSIGWLYIPLFIMVVVSTANAVNITDGLDGLAGGLLTTAFSVFAVIAYFQGSYGIAGFCAAVAGALLTFTWFSIYPMRFLMGDSGSFALGTALGVVAMLTNSVFVLPIVGFVFVIEAGSSVVQILSKKIRHKKIFLSAPLHHHLEAIGWPEPKVTMRLWVVGQVSGAVGMVLGLLGNKLS